MKCALKFVQKTVRASRVVQPSSQHMLSQAFSEAPYSSVNSRLPSCAVSPGLFDNRSLSRGIGADFDVAIDFLFGLYDGVP